MDDKSHVPKSMLWARFRFSIIGWLFAEHLQRGDLNRAFEGLAAKTWTHPIDGGQVRYVASTYERWYYLAKDTPDPVQALARKVPRHTGTQPSVPDTLLEATQQQYRNHPTWSYKLHYQNIEALVRKTGFLEEDLPSYSTFYRMMKAHGLIRQKKKRRGRLKDFQLRERRSFESPYVHALFHSDGHECSREVLMPDGSWQKPVAICVLDDRSRLVCHLQWYHEEEAHTVVHCWSQAFLKRGLSRMMLNDGGKAFHALEVKEGLAVLGIEQHDTLPYTPEQNGKQESFWAQVEGRLMAMLEGEKDLTLEELNRATQAWVELEYNRTTHSELTGYDNPLDCYLNAANVGRPSPDAAHLRRAFQITQSRRQRKSDGTLSIKGIRFEVPSQYRTLQNLKVRYARWDLTSVDLVDPHTGQRLATLRPQNKHANADGRRRLLQPVAPHEVQPPEPDGIAPLLREMIAEYAASGLPPAYVPFPYDSKTSGDDEDA